MKTFINGYNMLFVNTNLVSDYLIYLTKGTINYGLNILTNNNINQYPSSITFYEHMPKKNGKEVYAIYEPSTEGIIIGINKHIETAINRTKDDNNKWSIEALFILSFIDTILHETFNYNYFHNKPFPARLQFKEKHEQATKFAIENRLYIAQEYDVNELDFGIHIQTLIDRYYKELELIDEPYARFQLFLHEKGWVYKDDFSHLSNIYSLFSSLAPEENKFIKIPKRYTSIDTKEDTIIAPITTTVHVNTSIQDNKIPENNNIQPTVKENTDYSTPPPITEHTQPTIQNNTMNTNTANDGKNAMTKLAIAVFRHIYTVCQPTGTGMFHNIRGVYTPINISDIPNINMVINSFVSNNGITNTWMPYNGTIMGTITKDLLPKYTFKFIYNGQEFTRTFLVPNPKYNTKTSIQTKNGFKILHLITTVNYKDGIPNNTREQTKLLLMIRLQPNMHFGGEEVIWFNK